MSQKTENLPYFEISKDESGKPELVFHGNESDILLILQGLEMIFDIVKEPYGPKELPEDEKIRKEKLNRVRILKYQLTEAYK